MTKPVPCPPAPGPLEEYAARFDDLFTRVAQHPAVHRLQFFLSESRWDPEAVNARRLELLVADPATAPHDAGVLVIDDTGDRQDGRHTDHVAPQYLGSRGKIENGIVAVSSLRADQRVYYRCACARTNQPGACPAARRTR